MKRHIWLEREFLGGTTRLNRGVREQAAEGLEGMLKPSMGARLQASKSKKMTKTGIWELVNSLVS